MRRLLPMLTIVIVSWGANAGTISGIHSLPNGDPVDLSGLVWLDWDATNGMSRPEVEAELLAGGSLEGWRYATRSELEALFDSLWGGCISHWCEENGPGGDWLAAFFGGSTYTDINPLDNKGGKLFFGADGDCSPDITMTCWGQWRGTATSNNLGWFANSHGLSFGGGTGNNQVIIAKSFNDGRFASALVAVPAPGNTLLLALSLLGVLWMRRCRVQIKPQSNYPHSGI